MKAAAAHAPAAAPARAPPAARAPASHEPSPNPVWQAMALGAQAKLAVGSPDDPSEREADRVADVVMRSPASGVSVHVRESAPVGSIHRMCSECEEEAQRKASGGSVVQRKPDPPSGQPASTPSLAWMSGGEPLPRALRDDFEPRFGRDLGGVRLHTGGQAQSTARALSAQAFTHGSHIAFAGGRYQPDSAAGRRLIAHELTHVLQQGAAPAPAVQRQPEAEAETPAEQSAEGEEEAPSFSEIRDLLAAEEESSDPGEPDPEESEPAEAGGEGAAEGGGAVEPPPAAGEAGAGASGAAPPPAAVEEPETEEDGEAVEEVEIPTFDSGPESSCELIPEPPPLEEGDNAPAEPDESFFRQMLEFAGSTALSSARLGPVGAVVGSAAAWLWRQLPLSVRARAVNAGLDFAERFWSGGAALLTPPPAGAWVQAGLLAFFARLRAMPDALKVAIFEKIGSIALGRNLSFAWGYVKGLLRGFFVDGLVGILQMIVDVICLIPQIGRLLSTLRTLFGAFTIQMENLFITIGMLELAVEEALRNALAEIRQLFAQPWRILGMLTALNVQAIVAAKRMGTAMADAFIRLHRLSAESLGFGVGRVAGVIVFEVVLAVLTSGGGLAVTAGKTLTRVAVKMMATVGRHLLPVLRFMATALRTIRGAIGSVVRMLTPAFRRVGRVLGDVLDAIGDFFRRLLRICRPGSVVCRVPRTRGTGVRLRRAQRLWRRLTGPGATRPRRCDKRYIPRLGGFAPHDRYVRRVTGTTRDYRITAHLPRLRLPFRCSYDAHLRGQRLLVEGKTGYGWLANPHVQRRWWFPLVRARLNEQRLRCLAIATACGPYRYEWWVQNSGAASYLNSQWAGVPPVLHRR